MYKMGYKYTIFEGFQFLRSLDDFGTYNRWSMWLSPLTLHIGATIPQNYLLPLDSHDCFLPLADGSVLAISLLLCPVGIGWSNPAYFGMVTARIIFHLGSGSNTVGSVNTHSTHSTIGFHDECDNMIERCYVVTLKTFEKIQWKRVFYGRNQFIVFKNIRL